MKASHVCGAGCTIQRGSSQVAEQTLDRTVSGRYSFGRRFYLMIPDDNLPVRMGDFHA